MPYGFDQDTARRILEWVRRSERRPSTGSRRRRQPPVMEGAKLKVLGPCRQYILPESFADSDFDIEYPFGSDCTGPSRWGLNYVYPNNLNVVDVNLEVDTTNPLLFTSDTLTHICNLSLITVVIEFEVTILDRYGVELRFMQAGTAIATYQNTIASFSPGIGGYLQLIDADCQCGTFGPEICISPPDR